MTSRLTPTLVALALVAAVLSGCTPPPEPEPTPGPPFATEEEAFAAAEETYRAYVDALNQVDLSDPDTFEPVFALTTGELNNLDRQGLARYHADGVTVSGSSEVVALEPIRGGPDMATVFLAVCLDVSSVVVTAASGESLIQEDRVDVQTLEIEVVQGPHSGAGMLLTGIGPREGEPTCS